MTETAYKTSFGDSIPLNWDYLKTVSKSVRGDMPEQLFDIQYKTDAPPLSIGQFAYKHFEACMIYDALRKSGIGLKFDSMLDIGSGLRRWLKSDTRAREAASVAGINHHRIDGQQTFSPWTPPDRRWVSLLHHL